MSVVIETTLGDITVDLFLTERPRSCLNFLKLCKIKYYNYNLFHTISRSFIAQTGDPTGSRSGGESIFGVIDGPSKKYFQAETEPRIKHTRPGLISFVGDENNMIASQFFLTLGDDLKYLDEKHCVFGEVVEGFDVLESINEVICDNDDRPYQDIRITHTVVLDDPFPDPKSIKVPSRSPSPSAERLAGGRIAPDEEIDETSGKSAKEVAEVQADREAKARATILEMIGDIPDAEMAPPENVLFVCKLNPITNDDDLEIIFSRFGKIKSCEVIRDKKSGDSLQYAFIEFEDQKSCEDAYFKMDNVLVDDRRIHVDFSQSVSKVKWLGKGRGVAHYDERGNKTNADMNNVIGKGDYKVENGSKYKKSGKRNNERHNISPGRESDRRNRRQSSSPSRNSRKSNQRSPKRGNYRNSFQREKSRSPERSRRKSRSPEVSRLRRRTPQLKWRENRSPRRRRGHSRSPRRINEPPFRRKQRSRSPDYSQRRNLRRQSPQKSNDSPSSRRRNTEADESKSYSSRHRSRSPLGINRSQQPKRDDLNEKQSRSSGRKSRSPSPKSKSPTRRRSKSPTKAQKQGSLKRSETPKQEKKVTSPQRYFEQKKDKDRSSNPDEQKVVRTKGDKVSLQSTKGKSYAEYKKSKTISKTKKEKKIDSSDETESEEEHKQKLKKKKKMVESSSTDSSSSEESSSSSEEERVKKKSSKKRTKKRKSKRSRKRKSSSSSDSESESSSSSSESESDSYKKKKSKKKRTKDSSKSD